MPDQSSFSRIPHVGLLVVESILMTVLGLVGAALLLYAALIALRAGTPQETQWYEAVAFIPMVPGVLLTAAACWLFDDARDRYRSNATATSGAGRGDA
jgi:hypothetical protein